MTDLQALIDKIESAAAGSRELDADIAVALGCEYRSRRTRNGKNKGREWFIDSVGGIETWSHHPPAYTTRPYDLTAAVEALPEGWRIWYIGQCLNGTGGVDIGGPFTSAATPALAMTAAMLRAHHSEREKQR